MFRKQGLIAKIKDNYCIVVTREGTYKRIPIPAGGARPGMEVIYRDFDFYPLLKPVMLAASLLILIVGLTLFRQAAVPPAVAYVSLDINPSLELAVNKDLQVVAVNFFNDDGVNMVQESDLKGQNLYDALKILVQKAIEQNYIKPDRKNLMVSTIASTTADTTGLDPAKLQQALESAIAEGGLTGEVRVYPVDQEVRTIAEQNGLSPGKYIIYEQVKESGAKVSIKEAKDNSIRELVDVYKIKLLPNHKKIIIKKPDNNGQPRVFINENGNLVPAAAKEKNDDFRDEIDEDEDEDEDDHDSVNIKRADKDDDEDGDEDKNKRPGAPQTKTDNRPKGKIEDKQEDDKKDADKDEDDDDDKDEKNRQERDQDRNQDKNKKDDKPSDSGDNSPPDASRDHHNRDSDRDSDENSEKSHRDDSDGGDKDDDD